MFSIIIYRNLVEHFWSKSTFLEFRRNCEKLLEKLISENVPLFRFVNFLSFWSFRTIFFWSFGTLSGEKAPFSTHHILHPHRTNTFFHV